MASILAQRIVVMYPFRTSHVFYFIPNFDHFFLRSPSNDIEGYSVQSRSNKMRAKVYIYTGGSLEGRRGSQGYTNISGIVS